MSGASASAPPIISNILHPSDFSDASQVAFAHALKAALISKSILTLVHVAQPSETAEWGDFPGVRETLERWGLLPPGSRKSAVPKLGIDVKKYVGHDTDPVRSVMHYLDGHPTDVIVLATSQHEGRMRWLRKSVAEPIARKSGQMTLFVPAGVPGFISFQDGSVSLKNILIPVADAPEPQPAVTAAARIVRQLGCPAGTFTLLHVGGPGPIDKLYRPDVPGWTWQTKTPSGEVTSRILEAADEIDADLIVMSTAGRHGFLDALRGSHSEQVLHRAACPLLAVPEHSLAADAMRM
ncbi:MAG TPA: universal stress protein [Gemmataceae bacterium]|jgi:nucleotide-binding universal stress UspA family protein|nr:universal stress protein [Gemmataceae bacterium]